LCKQEQVLKSIVDDAKKQVLKGDRTTAKWFSGSAPTLLSMDQEDGSSVPGTAANGRKALPPAISLDGSAAVDQYMRLPPDADDDSTAMHNAISMRREGDVLIVRL
jgi:hypothetical protein